MEALVSAPLGPMGRLLRQLHLLRTRPPDGVSQGEIQDLTELLEGISISLKDLSEAEDPSFTAKCWMKEVRELCYDTEVLLDDSDAYAYQQGNGEHMDHVKAEYEILKARAGYAIERLKSYKIDPRSFRTCPFSGCQLRVVDASQIDHGLTDLDLEKSLDIGKEEQLKVVSLVGPEGVGKTTLAKKLYNKLTGQFYCRAFLRASPKPDIVMLLTSLFIQILQKQPSRSVKVQDLIINIAEHLQNKRYLILLDDLWSASVWHIISRALPVGECCSRILITTQIQDIALACCDYQSKYVLKMEPLNDTQSGKLFFNRAFGSEALFCTPDLIQISYGIMRKCGGLPLSIVNMTSLLASEPKLEIEQLKHISDSLPSTLMGSPTSEGIKEVVKFVYDNLPPRLKTCLLYVSMYPAGYTIVKDDLVKQWVAEDFVSDVHTATGYFEELVTGGLIQPVDTDDIGEVLTCTVHHIVLDLIANKSMEENFIITLNDFHSTIALPEKVRRVSVQFGGARSANISASIIMSEVRSLFFFGFSDIVPPIGDYKYIRVLALHIWAHQDKTFDLARVKELLRLRYLKIVCNIPVKLPGLIQCQQHLEILEVYGTLVAIPQDIGELHKLRILKIAVKKLSIKDTCFLQSLSALTALSVHVKTAPIENIVFGKGGFPVLEVFTFRCAPRLLIQAYAMPKLQKLKLSFNANEAHQYGTIIIEHLPSLNEISAKIWGSSVKPKHAFLSAIRNHPLNPVVQLMEFREEKELWTLEEQDENMEEDFDGTYEVQNEGSGGVEINEEELDETYRIQNKGSGRSKEIMEEDNDETNVIQDIRYFSGPWPGTTVVDVTRISTRSELELELSEWSSRVHVPSSTVDPSSLPAVEWAIASVGWIISPIIRRLMDKTFHNIISSKSMNMLHNLVTRTLPRLALALEAAESSNPGKYFQDVVRGLTTALYNMEDILDVLAYIRHHIQMNRRQKERNASNDDVGTINQGASFKYIWKELPLRSHMRKIKLLILEAHETTERAKLPINEESYKYAPNLAVQDTQKPSTAYPIGGVIGRDKDRDKMIQSLRDHDYDLNASSSNIIISVIGITGIPWSGKTTLAQHVCMFEKNEPYFDLVVWIHVSQNFRLETIFRKMFEAASGMVCPQYMSLDVLVTELEKNLYGKRFLLVLDDVWCDKDVDEQNLSHLIYPLKVGKIGSKVIVTSRNADALSDLGPDVRYTTIPISDLDDEAFFKLFMQYALRGARVDDADRRKLEQIGAEIVQKLMRSPLAARIVGEQLRRRQEVAFWLSVRDGDLLNETMRTLWSYLHLDDQIARCFAYCGIFPKGYHLYRDELVNLWVAEGFIKTNRGEEIEAVGQGHFAELVATSCLHPGGKDHDGKDYYLIPDLLHELVQKVAGGDSFRIKKNWKGVVPQDVRHLFIEICDAAILKENKIFELKNLCTLIIDRLDYEEGVFQNMFKGLRKLRVLQVVITTNELLDIIVPASIGQLKHLRYLALRAPVCQIILPMTFAKLYHMQVLDIDSLSGRQFSSGECKDTASLIHLRYVDMTYLPFPNIGRLTLLKTLRYFIVRSKEGYGINQLRNLNKLRGRLSISGLENVRSEEEALEANLVSKEQLTELEMHWDSTLISPYVAEGVLEGLCPPAWLERLVIFEYHGYRYPNWMVGEHNVGPKHLQELRLSRCGQLGPAPDLFKSFIHLHSLWLEDCSWDNLPYNIENLTSLKVLSITACVNIRSLPTLPQFLDEFILHDCDEEFSTSCQTVGHPNWQKIEHIPNKLIKPRISWVLGG